VDFNMTLIGQSIAMLVFVWFCMKFIWPPITDAIEARQRSIADGLAAAERGQDDLKKANLEAEKIVAEARDQAKSIVDQASSRATGLVDEGRADGESERNRQIEAAQAEIEIEINRARDELRGQVAVIAVAGAQKILAREIDAGAHKALLDELAAEL